MGKQLPACDPASRHIGASQCADWFHSWDQDTVLKCLDSQDPGNLGISYYMNMAIFFIFNNTEYDNNTDFNENFNFFLAYFG